MRSIAIMNQKGGVGKTTTAVNLSAALAEQKYRVCLIDLDPQAHASLHLGVHPEEEFGSIYQVLLGQSELTQVCQPVNHHLSVVPSHLDLAAAEVELAGEVGRETILHNQFKREDFEEAFDFVIIDCPPSLGILTLNALTAVNEVFLPLQAHFLALHGVSKLLNTIDLVSKRLNPRLRLTGIIFCMFDAATKLAAEVTEDITQFFAESQDRSCCWSGAQIFGTKIRRNIRLAEAPSFGQSIFQYAAKSNGAIDYAQLAEEVLGIGAVLQDSKPVTSQTTSPVAA